MSKTNEIIHNNIEMVTSHITNLIDILNLTKQDALKDSITAVNLVIADYGPINLQYLCEITDMLSKDKNKLKDSPYHYMILSHNIISRLQIYGKQITDFIKEMQIVEKIEKCHITTVKSIIHKLSRIDLNIKIQTYDCDICENCMEVTDSKAINDTESKCIKCGLIKSDSLEEHNYDDINDMVLTTPTSQKHKRGTHEAEKHCYFWLDKITAINETAISDKEDVKIHSWFKINNIKNKRLLTCQDYRRCFKETYTTRLNQYVTHVRQMYSGIPPPRISWDEKRQIVSLFVLAVEKIEDLGLGGNNIKYYPYFIYKIVPHCIRDKLRSDEILNCIHLQSPDTCMLNDQIWMQVCDSEYPIRYEKTDSNA
jgi:hypothetical protein